jgi:hypothetical protein
MDPNRMYSNIPPGIDPNRIMAGGLDEDDNEEIINKIKDIIKGD